MDKYVFEKIAGSKTYYLAKEEIASDLYVSLREFSDVLKDYLSFFVDAPVQEYNALGFKPCFRSIPSNPSYVFTFNYTNTFEFLYNHTIIDHIHGNTTSGIVLGINPDDRDNIETIDTTFLQFKKYFQRVYFKTDIFFLQSTEVIKNSPLNQEFTLYVIGHSLDSTDQDMIKKIFELPQAIRILYHNESSVKNQIKNLVEIYGKEGLDRLRELKDLEFIHQSEIQWKASENN